jgi:hypothetical protein
MTKVLPDGRQVYALNLKPKFFDISKVWKPADRTAYVLKKVAREQASNSPYLRDLESELVKQASAANSNQPYTSSPIRQKPYVEPRLRKQAWDKIAFIQKLSELEKRIEGELAGEAVDGKVKAVKSGITKVDLPDEVLDELGELPKSTAYASLADKGIVLRPKEFLRMNMGDSAPKTNSLLPLIRGIFSKLSKRDDLESYWPQSDYDLDSCKEHSKVSRIFEKFVEPRSILREPAVNRTITLVIMRGPKSPELQLDKKELEKESSFTGALATMYGLYKASALKYILERNGDLNLDTDNVPAVSAILENYL